MMDECDSITHMALLRRVEGTASRRGYVAAAAAARFLLQKHVTNCFFSSIIFFNTLFFLKQDESLQKNLTGRLTVRLHKKEVSKVIWQKAVSPACDPSRMRMHSSDLDPHLTHCSLDSHESAPNAISIDSAVLQGARTCSTDRRTDRRTDHATPSVAIARILCTKCM